MKSYFLPGLYCWNFPSFISSIFSFMYLKKTCNTWLWRHVYRSFNPIGHADKICLGVPTFPHLQLSSSEIFHLTKFAGVGSISYVDFSRKLSLAGSHSQIFFQFNLRSITLSSHLRHFHC